MATNALSPLSPEHLEQLGFLFGKEGPTCVSSKAPATSKLNGKQA